MLLYNINKRYYILLYNKRNSCERRYVFRYCQGNNQNIYVYRSE